MIEPKRIVLCCLALAMLAGLFSRAHAQVTSAERPPDITEFVSRRASCADWSQKAIDIWSANDPGRAAELEAPAERSIAERRRARRTSIGSLGKPVLSGPGTTTVVAAESIGVTLVTGEPSVG